MPHGSAEHQSGPRSGVSSDPARLTIVSSVRLYREGLAQALGKHASIAVVAECADHASALAQQPAHRAQIILIDSLSLICPGAVSPSCDDGAVPLVAYGLHEHDDTALACVRLGARGLVAADDPLDDLVVAATTVLSGEIYCSPRLATLFVREVARHGVPETEVGSRSLTAREGEIALLLQTGASNKEIARRLGIEVATVKTHVHKVLAKLQLHRRAEAAALAARRGWHARAPLRESPIRV